MAQEQESQVSEMKKSRYEIIRCVPQKTVPWYGLWDAQEGMYLAICPTEEAVMAAWRLLREDGP